MPPYTHLVTSGTGVHVRHHSVSSFLEAYGDDRLLTIRDLHDIFNNVHTHDEYVQDMFFDENAARAASLPPPTIQTSITRVAVDNGEEMVFRDYTSPVTYRDCLGDTALPEGMTWNVFTCLATRQNLACNGIQVVSWDRCAHLDDTVPPWNGKSFRLLMAVPPAERYVVVRVNTHALNNIIILPAEGRENISNETIRMRILDAVIPLLNLQDGHDVVSRYVYTYTPSEVHDDSLLYINCHIYIRDPYTDRESCICPRDVKPRPIDASGMLEMDDMHTIIANHTTVVPARRTASSLRRHAFWNLVSMARGGVSSLLHQRFKIHLHQRDAEIMISYYIDDAVYRGEATLEPSRPYRLVGDPTEAPSIIDFVSHYLPPPCDHQIDTVMERIQRLDTMVPNFFGSQHGIQNRILSALSDRDMTYPTPDERTMDHMTRSIRLANACNTLYEYQKENVRWMIAQEHARDGIVGLFAARITGDPGGPGIFRRLYPETSCAFVTKPDGVFTSGGMLCDDVGMGKTRQIIELIRCTSTPTTAATLIVVPPNVIDQWRREITTVWPEASVAMYHGRHKRYVNVRELRDYDIVLTTPRMETSLPGTVWERMVIDESHIVKSISPRHTASKKWVVTATPSTKLACQLRWLIGRNAAAFYSVTADRTDRFFYMAWPDETILTPKRLYVFLDRLMTRKTRDVHAMLPDVRTHRHRISMHDDDVTYYQSIIDDLRGRHVYSDYVNIMNTASALTAAASFGRRYVYTNDHIRTGHHHDQHFMRERTIDPHDIPKDDLCAICISPIGTADVAKTGCGHWFCEECLSMYISVQQIRLMCPMCRAPILHGTIERPIPIETETPDVQDTSNEIDTTTYVSAKMSRFVHDVQTKRREDDASILVFVNQKRQLDFLGSLLAQHDIPYMTVHGSMPVERRNIVFSSFQERASDAAKLVLTTTKCASAGLTLTTADVIMLISPSEDTSTEEQIIGRARRIGRPPDTPIDFMVYISEGTIEDDIEKERESHRLANVWDITRRVIET